ncbi:MAG: glycosyltransferase family 4 protein [Candidatus Thiodiazotropha taylori]|nr:glycosyltransferase family 4 protein [Candidatus Thiodiazotropha taylori]MCW4316699.1 glycosyltransferase family 4 protein [Candidatus Thiodiazotropha taylori]
MHRILLYLEGNSLAGSERVAQQIANYVWNEGMDVVIASCGPTPSPLGTAWQAEGRDYVYFQADVSPQQQASVAAPPHFEPWCRAMLQRFAPEVILANNGGYPWHTTCLAAVKIARTCGISRRYLVVHSTPETAIYNTEEQAADYSVADSCSAIVVGSLEVARQIARARPPLADRLKTISYGVSEPGERCRLAHPDLIRFGMAADLRGPRKGQNVFIDALVGLKGEEKCWCASIAGDGPGLEEIRHSAGNLPVEFKGRLAVSEMPGFYWGLDVYVLPSLQEGLSLTILEAMAHGLPVIASDVGGHCDAINHGENGFLVVPGDRMALRTAMKTLLNDDALRSEMGQQSRRRFLDHFQLQDSLQAWMELLRGNTFVEKMR